ncbi:MAG: phenylacetate--CoA ligase [Deltaproteobacteria bacterium]|jgi:phenylacetate-CoA ligase|nr:MAG: phenylacetate--CoA ligase [Deltaproteobacteria bacterium]
MNIWDKAYECMPREELEQLQLERLQSTLNRVYKNVQFYRKIFDKLNVLPEDIQSIQGLSNLPFTTKDDLRNSYPYDMFAVSLREVVRLHSTSGMTGKPIVVGYTKNDLKNWTNLAARILTAGGVTKDDMVQIAFAYGLLTGAFGLHYGAEEIGASVIPTSSGHTEKQIIIMKDYKTTALVCTPSYALRIADTMVNMEIDPKTLNLRLGLFGGEPWSENMRKEIEGRLYIDALDNYGLSEVIGPGVAAECQYKDGLHLFEDHFIPEIIDPSTGTVLPPGEKGELVITTLTKEAFPMIRFRTGDITKLNWQQCECARTCVRIEKIMERTDNMLIIKGVSVFPSQIEQVLYEFEGCEPHFQLVVDRKDRMDVLKVLVEVSERIFFDEMKKQGKLLENIKQRLSSVLGVNVDVKLVEPQSIERDLKKYKRIIDNRVI